MPLPDLVTGQEKHESEIKVGIRKANRRYVLGIQYRRCSLPLQAHIHGVNEDRISGRAGIQDQTKIIP